MRGGLVVGFLHHRHEDERDADGDEDAEEGEGDDEHAEEAEAEGDGSPFESFTPVGFGEAGHRGSGSDNGNNFEHKLSKVSAGLLAIDCFLAIKKAGRKK